MMRSPAAPHRASSVSAGPEVFLPSRRSGAGVRWSGGRRRAAPQPESTPLANPPHLGFNPGQACETGRLPHAAQSACFPQPALAPGAHGRPHHTRPELPSPGHDGRRPHHQSTGNQAKPQVRSPFGRAAPKSDAPGQSPDRRQPPAPSAPVADQCGRQVARRRWPPRLQCPAGGLCAGRASGRARPPPQGTCRDGRSRLPGNGHAGAPALHADLLRQGEYENMTHLPSVRLHGDCTELHGWDAVGRPAGGGVWQAPPRRGNPAAARSAAGGPLSGPAPRPVSGDFRRTLVMFARIVRCPSARATATR